MSNTIPFGCKSSAFIYHSIGLLTSHYFRSQSIPCSLYIDDRHTVELNLPILTPKYALFTADRARSFALASSAIFIVCLTFVSLGYYIILVPRQVSSHTWVFWLTSVRKLSFSLRRSGKRFPS